MSRTFVWSVAIAALAVAPAVARAQESTATYLLLFDATWQASTHPTDIPPDPHFSPLVAATHDAGVAFWAEGGLASSGIEFMAEQGDPFPLASEMQAAAAAGRAHAVAIGGGTASPGGANVVIEASLAHPLATVVSMVAPSPDWFVGVAGVALFVNGAWVDEVSYSLHPYDAGTDAGPTFLSPDADLTPQLPIEELTGFPFAGAPPLGTFTFVRTDPARACANGVDDDGDGAIDLFGDVGCSDLDDASELEATLPCDDGIDNDGDGRFDGRDLGCETEASPTESPECSDGINNDPGQDANVDFDGGVYATGAAVAPRDGWCTAPWQASERRPRSCGVGFEAAPALAFLAAGLRRARRRQRAESPGHTMR
jgi:hypothetical protein